MAKRGRPKDLRSPLAKARDFFFWTREGEELCAGKAEGQYLKNRLERAFIAGWNAHEKSIKYQ